MHTKIHYVVLIVYVLVSFGCDLFKEELEGPSSLVAIPATNSITLYWKDNSDKEDEFQIQRKTADGPYTRVAAVIKANTTSYTDNGLNANTEYTYRIRASNAVGC